MQQKYRLYRRRNGNFYWQENDSKKQGSLRTTDGREAESLLNATNESHRQPALNLSLALALIWPRMIPKWFRGRGNRS